jgi:hypothetical protein
MLSVLRDVELALPSFLSSIGPDGWESLLIDDEEPVVKRVWRPFGKGRLMLHMIYPCGEPLMHLHRWPSAMRVVEGAYEMKVGFQHYNITADVIQKPDVMTTILREGSAYEMVNPDTLHSVRPIGGPSLSMMVTGAPWRGANERAKKRALGPLQNHDKEAILWAFRHIYSRNSTAIGGPWWLE